MTDISERDMKIAQAVRQACCNSYSPDDLAGDWSEKMAGLNLTDIIRAAAPAAVVQAEPSELPPLPESDWVLAGSAHNRDAYTADQMREYARAALAQPSAQAEPSEAVAYLVRLQDGRQVNLCRAKDEADETARAYGNASTITPLYAQPSAQDKLDAERYRWLRVNVDSYVPDAGLPALWEHKKGNDYGMKEAGSLDAAIDAILAARSAK